MPKPFKQSRNRRRAGVPLDETPVESYVLRFDGAITKNPGGTMRWVWTLHDPEESLVAWDRGHGTPGLPRTVNVAEFLGLLKGLEHAAGRDCFGLPHLAIRGDSQLIVCGVRERWKFPNSPHLLRLRDQCLTHLASLTFPFLLQWVRRELNEECDALAQRRNGRWLLAGPTSSRKTSDPGGSTSLIVASGFSNGTSSRWAREDGTSASWPFCPQI